MRDVRESNPSDWVRYWRGLERVRSDVLRTESRKWREVHVVAWIGRTDTGKTRRCYATYGYDAVYALTRGNNGVWFDGYDGEDVLLIDDFYGWIPYGFLLRLLDGHPVQVEVKGGFTHACWTKVVITSNRCMDRWYNLEKIGSFAALERRINETVDFYPERVTRNGVTGNTGPSRGVMIAFSYATIHTTLRGSAPKPPQCVRVATVADGCSRLR